jgi:heme/copper-type cytochrome/quinol oxidase subunit 2
MDIIVPLVLAIVVCALAVAFMFKAGSNATNENSAKHVRFYIITWGVLGVTLVAMRFIISIRHVESFAAVFTSSEGIKEIVLAVLLFILYAGTGLAAYQAGLSLGNVRVARYNTLMRKIHRRTKKLNKLLVKILVHHNRCLAMQSQNNINLEKEYKDIKAQFIASKINDIVIKKFRDAALIVTPEIFPVGADYQTLFETQEVEKTRKMRDSKES